jgi:hypothetical protein
MSGIEMKSVFAAYLPANILDKTFAGCLRSVLAVTLLCLSGVSSVNAGIQDWIASFATSDFVFQRSTSNVPFPPIGFLNLNHYGDTELDTGEGDPLSFDQTVLSQAAMLPLLTGQRDALLIGEWVNWTQFDSNTPALDSFDVLSLGMPIAWMRQVNPSWQAAAFVFPIGHKANLEDSAWSWELMGGAFARYVQTERLWWGFGFFLDVGHGEDLYLPYLGASWSIDDQWTLSAVMPWPAVLYAPTPDRVFRLGVMPSGASWSIDPGTDEVEYDLGGWNLGLGAAWRLQGNFWFNIQAGYSGLQTLQIDSDGVQSPELDLDGAPFVGFGIEYRPAIL